MSTDAAENRRLLREATAGWSASTAEARQRQRDAMRRVRWERACANRTKQQRDQALLEDLDWIIRTDRATLTTAAARVGRTPRALEKALQRIQREQPDTAATTLLHQLKMNDPLKHASQWTSAA